MFYDLRLRLIGLQTYNNSTDPSKPVSHKVIPKSLYQKNELMKIISWNIQDGMNRTEGLKTEDNGFSSILNASTIFCLQETKTNITFQTLNVRTNPGRTRVQGVSVLVFREPLQTVL